MTAGRQVTKDDDVLIEETDFVMSYMWVHTKGKFEARDLFTEPQELINDWGNAVWSYNLSFL